MLTFVIKRVGLGAILVLLVLTLVFSALHLVPGDPAVLLLSSGDGGAPSRAAVESLRTQLGLDQSLLNQYLNFLGGVFEGDLGQSFRTDDAVTGMIFARLPRTLELVLLATLISLVIGIPLGSWAARAGGKVDNVVSMATSFGVAMPVYVLGSIFVLVFSLKLGWFPAGGFVTWAQDPLGHLRVLILPALSLALGFSAVIARMTRSEVFETQNQDWVRTAKSFGLAPSTVFRRHVLRNSLIPVVTIVGLGIGTLLGSTVLAERVFNYPGLSSLLIDSVATRDYPTVQGIVIVIAMLFISITILVDICYGLLDPRVRN